MSNIALFGSNAALPAHIAALAAQVQDDKDDFGGGGPRLVTLSIRGKEFRFRTNGQENSTGLRDLECIVVRRREKISRRYYGSKYKPGSVDAPTCHSIDGERPDRGTAIQAESCAVCPRAVWGSKVTENGDLRRECDMYKMLALVPFVGGRLTEQAVSLNLPATSIKRGKNSESGVMHAKEYFSALKQHGLPAIGAVTRIKFTSAESPQIQFEFVRHATEEELQHAIALRDSDIVVGAVEGTVVEEEGAITPTPKPVIEAPKVQPDPIKLADLPKVTEETKSRRTVARPATKVVEAEVVGEAVPAADPMEAVKKLLAGLK